MPTAVLPQFVRPLLLTLLAFTAAAGVASASDTTIVVWDRQPIYSAYRVDFERLRFPGGAQSYRRIVMTLKLECPRGGCDPWDRTAMVWIIDPRDAGRIPTTDLNYYYYDARKFEIGRLVTPYGRGWTWEFDVTHYRTLLTDSATLGAYITAFSDTGKYGQTVGYLLSISFRFEEGTPDFRPVAVRNLWQGEFLYGYPEDPIENHLHPIEVDPSGADFATARVTAVGYGQGNTDHAAEFAKKWHTLTVGDATFGHYLWRDDCDENPVGPQYGSWDLERAGFCPGSPVYPWVNDISRFIDEEKPFTIDYSVEPYENRCRPGVEPCPCENCEYTEVSHTKPSYGIEGQVVFYEIPESDPGVARSFSIARGAADYLYTVRPSLASPTDITVSVLNPLGTVVYRHVRRGVRNEPFTVDISPTPGRYQLKIETPLGTYRAKVE